MRGEWWGRLRGLRQLRPKILISAPEKRKKRNRKKKKNKKEGKEGKRGKRAKK